MVVLRQWSSPVISILVVSQQTRQAVAHLSKGKVLASIMKIGHFLPAAAGRAWWAARPGRRPASTAMAH